MPSARTRVAGRTAIVFELMAVAVAAAFSYGWFWLGRGLDVPDEGLLLHVAERLAAGEVPYRDVYFIYTPGFQYLLALLFKLFGPSLAVEHLLLLAVHVGLAVVVYGLAVRLASRSVAIVVTLAVMATGVSAYRTLVALIALAALIGYVETRRQRWLIATGVLAGGSYLIGQEVGVYTLAAACGYVAVDWATRPERKARWPEALRRIGVVVGAALVTVAPWLAILASQGAFGDMITDTLRVAFLHQPRYMHVDLPPVLPLVPNELSEQVVWGSPPYLSYVKVVIYLPVVVVAIAAGMLGASLVRGQWHGGQRQGLAVALLAAAMLGTVGFRADYYHVRQVLPVYVLLAGWVAAQAIGGAGTRRRRMLRAAAALAPLVAVASIGFGEAAVERGRMNATLESARGAVLVDATTARDLSGVLQALGERTSPHEPIYVAPAETAVYFLADRPNPTRFGQLVPTELELLRENASRQQHEVVAATEQAGVRWIVSGPTENVNGYAFGAYAPVVDAHLRAHFESEASFGYWTLLRRRD